MFDYNVWETDEHRLIILIKTFFVHQFTKKFDRLFYTAVVSRSIYIDTNYLIKLQIKRTFRKPFTCNATSLTFVLPLTDILACAITLNYCTYTNHVGVSPRALDCVVDTSYGLGRSLGHCIPALPKVRKYQMVKTQTQSHDRRPVV